MYELEHLEYKVSYTYTNKLTTIDGVIVCFCVNVTQIRNRWARWDNIFCAGRFLVANMANLSIARRVWIPAQTANS
jgi:hypothetical protein